MLILVFKGKAIVIFVQQNNFENCIIVNIHVTTSGVLRLGVG
jgi:hypothetical protein